MAQVEAQVVDQRRRRPPSKVVEADQEPQVPVLLDRLVERRHELLVVAAGEGARRAHLAIVVVSLLDAQHARKPIACVHGRTALGRALESRGLHAGAMQKSCRWLATIAGACFLVAQSAGCVPAALSISDDHPASPRSAPAPLPPVASVLRDDPVPLPHHDAPPEPGHGSHVRSPAAGQEPP